MITSKDLSSKGLSRFGRLAEKYGRQAVEQAIAEHKAAGNPIYITNKKGQLIKELADGRQFLVDVSLEDGSETVGKQIR